MTIHPRFEIGDHVRLTMSDGAVFAVRILDRKLGWTSIGAVGVEYKVEPLAAWPDGAMTPLWFGQEQLTPTVTHELEANDATLGAPSVSAP